MPIVGKPPPTFEMEGDVHTEYITLKEGREPVVAGSVETVAYFHPDLRGRSARAAKGGVTYYGVIKENGRAVLKPAETL